MSEVPGVSHRLFSSETDRHPNQPLAPTELHSHTGGGDGSVWTSILESDPLLLFLPEALEDPIITDEPEPPAVHEPNFAAVIAPARENHLLSRIGAVVTAGARRITCVERHSWVAARLASAIPISNVGLSRVRTTGMNTWPIDFTCGIAAGALGMWLFHVPPPAQATAAEGHSPVVTTELMPSATAPDGTASRETPAPPAVETGPVVAAVSAPITVTDRPDTQRSAVAPQRRDTDRPRELPAEAASSMPFKGSLALNSWPRGAQAFVDGKAAGTTPLALSDLPVGSRVVRLEAEGYQTWSAAVRVIANQQTQVTATLYRDPTRP